MGVLSITVFVIWGAIPNNIIIIRLLDWLMMNIRSLVPDLQESLWPRAHKQRDRERGIYCVEHVSVGLLLGFGSERVSC